MLGFLSVLLLFAKCIKREQNLCANFGNVIDFLQYQLALL